MTHLKERVLPDWSFADLELVIRSMALLLESVGAVGQTSREPERLALRLRERGAWS